MVWNEIIQISGALFFGTKTGSDKLIGVMIGIAGSALLLYSNKNVSGGHLSYTGFVVLATLLYGINVNMVHKKLSGVSSVQIAAIAFTGLIPPALIVLLSTGYFQQPLSEHTYIMSTIASSVLGIVGTALASVLFYVLVKKAGGLFASLVTYGIPFIAILWGVYYGETVTYLQIVALCIILLGVYLANRTDRKK